MALVPVIAGVSYEFIRLAGNTDNKLVGILSRPGMWLQALTTKEPDDSMIEVAIAAVEAVFDWRAWQGREIEEAPEQEKEAQKTTEEEPEQEKEAQKTEEEPEQEKEAQKTEEEPEQKEEPREIGEILEQKEEPREIEEVLEEKA